MRISDWSSDVCSSDLDFEIGFAEQAIGFDLQIVGVVAEKRLAQNRGRQAVGVGRESAEKAREIIDREGVHIIAVLGQVIIGINAAEQEVERPVKIAGQDRFARPACIILVRSVELQRLVATNTVAAEHAASGVVRLRRAENAGRTIRSEEHTSELQSLMRISYAVFCLQK